MNLNEMIDEFISDLERSSTDLKYPWQEHAEAALQETDPIRKSARIAYAETALYRRLQALRSGDDASEELEALKATIEHLQRTRTCH
jgi:hypothetical protein